MKFSIECFGENFYKNFTLAKLHTTLHRPLPLLQYTVESMWLTDRWTWHQTQVWRDDVVTSVIEARAVMTDDTTSRRQTPPYQTPGFLSRTRRSAVQQTHGS